jgi:hypothetical protein
MAQRRHDATLARLQEAARRWRLGEKEAEAVSGG